MICEQLFFIPREDVELEVGNVVIAGEVDCGLEGHRL
jgi:hypothetical protein